MTLRVMHVTQPTDAGVPAVLLRYLASQRAVGDLNLAVACPAGNHLSEQVQAMGAEFLPWQATRDPGMSVLAEVRELRRLVRSWRPDLIHLHSSKAGLVGRLAVRGRIPTVFQPHAWSFEAVDGVTASLSRLWERQASHWAHVTVCVSAAEWAAAPTSGIRARAQVIPNTVDPSLWKAGERSIARAQLHLDPDAPYAMCIGRLCEQKGQESLVALWPAIRDRVAKAQLVLVGSGPLASALGRLCPPGVSLVGPQDVADWYAASDLVVVPSRWEAMALVPLEAQAAGRMVLGYDVHGMAESLGPSNVLVPVGNRDQLADALASALLDLPRTHQRGIQGRQFALRTWSPEHQLDLLQTAYRDAGQRREYERRHKHRRTFLETLPTESVALTRSMK